MIIDDFYVVRIPALPTEADPPLVIDSNAVLALAVAAEFLEAIGRWNSKVMDPAFSCE